LQDLSQLIYIELLDGAIQVSKDEAYDFTAEHKEEGMLVEWCFLSGGRKKLSEILKIKY
jgi:hypothetical protein